MEKIASYGLSFEGRRSNNEDSYRILQFKPDVCFLAVADGMGGATSGQYASELVLDTAEKYLQNITKNGKEIDDLKLVISKIFFIAQEAISTAVKKNPKLSGMGTTLTCVLIKDKKYVIGNIGDSRVYKISNDSFFQVTEDHTYIEDFKKKNKGEIDKDILSKYSHYLLKSLDGGKDEPDIFPADKPYEELKPGEGFLLCSDGLIIDKTNEDTENFRQYLLGTKTLNDAAKYLVSQAYQNGSSDNITIVLANYGQIN